MKFSKHTYWSRRKKGYRGQINYPGSKEFDYEQRRIAKQARKLWLERQKESDDKKEVKENS